MRRLLLLPLVLLLACDGPEPEPVRTPESKAKAAPTEPGDDGTTPLFHARRLKVTDKRVGKGPAVGEQTTRVVVHLQGRLTGGYVFQDTRRGGGEPLRLALDAKEVVVGLARGLQGMRVGGKREIIVPPEIGFRGRKVGRIPPFSTLIYEVELLKVE